MSLWKGSKRKMKTAKRADEKTFKSQSNAFKRTESKKKDGCNFRHRRSGAAMPEKGERRSFLRNEKRTQYRKKKRDKARISGEAWEHADRSRGQRRKVCPQTTRKGFGKGEKKKKINVA